MSWSGLAQDTGIGNGTAQRINEMTSDASLSTIEAVALRYGLEAWHVLVPGLDPKNPPVFLMTDSERKLYDSLAKSALAGKSMSPCTAVSPAPTFASSNSRGCA